jgi:hypothetical protein
MSSASLEVGTPINNLLVISYAITYTSGNKTKKKRKCSAARGAERT